MFGKREHGLESTCRGLGEGGVCESGLELTFLLSHLSRVRGVKEAPGASLGSLAPRYVFGLLGGGRCEPKLQGYRDVEHLRVSVTFFIYKKKRQDIFLGVFKKLVPSSSLWMPQIRCN